MIGDTEPACLAIADISGYPEYLAGVELEHAQDILADLVTTVVTALRPTFRLAKLEGDAAFVYAAVAGLDRRDLRAGRRRCGWSEVPGSTGSTSSIRPLPTARRRGDGADDGGAEADARPWP